jgi:RNA polymerase sigma-70 factor (ECF subfamily)
LFGGFADVIIAFVPPIQPTQKGPCDCPAGTLGHLLYVGKAKSHTSEEEWVELVRAVAAGNQRALYALYERTHRLVFTLTMRIANNRATAEELTLDVFHDVWRRASKYDAAGGTVLGWIMNQARCRAIDRLRFERRKKRVNRHPGDPLLTDVTPGTDEALDTAELARALRNAITVLTPDERCAIESAFFSELSYAEVAARLNQPLGTIKTRIRSGLSKLREALSKGVTGS